MSPGNRSQKFDQSGVHGTLPASADAQSPPRFGAPDDRAAVTEQQARSPATAKAGRVVELHGQEARTKWRMRVHWGIVFAAVASLALWLLMRAFVSLAF